MNAPIDARAHANLVEFVRILGRLDGGAAELDEPGIFAIRGPTDFPMSRCALRQAGVSVAGACSILVGPEPNGYVGWVACHDDARGKGLGDVVTRRVTNEAFDRGASIVTLEASRFGEHTYARMGYRELYRYAVLIKM